jgi:hypothetical protein
MTRPQEYKVPLWGRRLKIHRQREGPAPDGEEILPIVYSENKLPITTAVPPPGQVLKMHSVGISPEFHIDSPGRRG